MKLEERIQLITRDAVEVLTQNDLVRLLKQEEGPAGYIGIEPSGLFHLGFSIWAQKVIDLVEAKTDMCVLWATWHAAINDKLGGDLEMIKACARYLEHCLFAHGLKPGQVRFIYAEDLMSDLDYWEIVLRVAKHLTLSRVKRAMTILGRKAVDAELDFAKCVYPCLQIADIFYAGFSICLGGIDQRRAHVLARELAPKLGFRKPVAIHTPILLGLAGVGRMEVVGEELFEFKMSKSKPEHAIFVHDPPEVVRLKIERAYCPPKETVNNPVIGLHEKLIFKRIKPPLLVERPPEYGGRIEYYSFQELVSAYRRGELHPADLKKAAADALIEILKPIQRYFETNREAAQLLEQLRQATITR